MLTPVIQEKVAKIARVAQTRGLMPTLRKGNKKVDKVWISPADWKRMGPEKQALLVSLWHRDRRYNDVFPFTTMEATATKATVTGNLKSIDSEGEGLTFSCYGSDDGMNVSSLIENMREAKIPHTIEYRRDPDLDDAGKDQPEAVASG